MQSKDKEVQFQMRISSVNVLRFSQYDIEDFDFNKVDAIEYQSDFAVKTLHETSEIAVEATLKLKVQELDCYFGELKVLMKFYVSPFDTVVKKVEDGYQVPDSFIVNLFNILIGTIRGILHEKLRGTVLQNEVLPLFDLRDLVNSKELR